MLALECLGLERLHSSPSAQPLERIAAERLRRSGYNALLDVSCTAVGDKLMLDGRLPSHYLKQVAQQIAVEVSGVRVVVNRITVPRSRRSPGRPGLISEPADLD